MLALSLSLRDKGALLICEKLGMDTDVSHTPTLKSSVNEVVSCLFSLRFPTLYIRPSLVLSRCIAVVADETSACTECACETLPNLHKATVDSRVIRIASLPIHTSHTQYTHTHMAEEASMEKEKGCLKYNQLRAYALLTAVCAEHVVCMAADQWESEENME